MPELPEVETICRGIKQKIIGKKILSTKTSDKKLRLPFPENLSSLNSQEIRQVTRRARYILLQTSNNQTLLIHLGMSGKLLYLNQPPINCNKHNHFVINFDDGSCLIYNDPRRFGLVDLLGKEIELHKMIKNLGPEPLSSGFNLQYLKEKLANKKTNIKTAMMDNKIVVGVGNIYVNEALFAAKISPSIVACKLNVNKLGVLVEKIKLILSQAIDLGGSSISDYKNLDGDLGNFQLGFKVYGRENQDCLLCNNKIIRIKQNGRSTFYCQQCQKI